MGKTGKWIKNLFTGKKEKVEKKETITKSSSISTENPNSIQPSTTKEKRRWSFRRSTATTKDLNPMESIATTCLQEVQAMMESQNGQIKHAMAMAAATAAAADAAVKAAHASATVIHLTTVATKRPSSVEEDAAIKIQSVFRSYLAKKALCALKGLVKLQALVRGHLVRKQANAALRCMQALVTVQARTRAQRLLMAQESQPVTQRQSTHRKPPHPHLQEHRVRQTYNDMEENIKIVEMDVERSSTHRSSYASHKQIERADHRFSTHYSGHHRNSNQDPFYEISPVPSALTDMSPRTCSGYFEEYSINLEKNSPQSSVSKPENPFADYPFFPNYMANTESSKAKVRSQSAPKQRPDSYERQLSKQRLSTEGRNIPRAVRMQRSSSHVGSTAHEYRHPWSIKLDKSTVSLKDSECGSTSTVLTNANYCRSLVGYEVHGRRC